MQGKIAFFSVILLLVGLAIDVCLLMKTSWDDIRKAYAQQNCATVQTFTGNGIKDTQPFTVTSDTWRLRYDFESTTGDQQSSSFEMTVYKPGNTIPESIITLERPGSDTSYVNAGAGTYYLSIGSANATWTVDVEECSASAPPGTPNPGPTSASGSASTPASTPQRVLNLQSPSVTETYSSLGSHIRSPTTYAERRVSAGILGAKG